MATTVTFGDTRGMDDIHHLTRPVDPSTLADGAHTSRNGICLVDPRAATGEMQPPIDSNIALVERAKAGDRDARDQLFSQHLPALRRWASGRLPRRSRDLMDTDDLVQETVIRVLNRLGLFDVKHAGALQAYLRKAIINRIRDEIRRSSRKPPATGLDDSHADHCASPLEAAIGREAVQRYAVALVRMNDEQRKAIMASVEMECRYQEVAEALGKRSPDAARMAVSRARVQLARELSDPTQSPPALSGGRRVRRPPT